MEAMRQSWTDERMDDLNAKVDRVDDEVRALRNDTRAEFTAVRGELKAEFVAVRAEGKVGFDRIEADFNRVHQRLDRLIFLMMGLLVTALLGLVTHA